MRHEERGVVIRSVGSAASPRSQRVLDVVAALYRRDQGPWNAEILPSATSASASDLPGESVLGKRAVPLIAILHWGGGNFLSAVSAMIEERTALVEVDLSAIEPGLRGAALALAVRELSSGRIDVVIMPTLEPLFEHGGVDSRCIFVSFEHERIGITVATHELLRLNGVFLENGVELMPLDIGLSLKGLCFVEDAAACGNQPVEPFQRFVKKLQALDVDFIGVEGRGSLDHLLPSERAFRLALGWKAEWRSSEPIVVMSCNEAAEPDCWFCLIAPPGSRQSLSLANSLLSVIASPELEWQRWLA